MTFMGAAAAAAAVWIDRCIDDLESKTKEKRKREKEEKKNFGELLLLFFLGRIKNKCAHTHAQTYFVPYLLCLFAGSLTSL